MRLARRAALPFAVSLALAACGGAGNRDEAIENLTSGPDGLTMSQAECVVDTIGEDKLADYDNFSDDFMEDFGGQFDGGAGLSDLGDAMGEVGELMGAFFSCAFADLGDAIGEGLGDAFDDPGFDPGDGSPVDCSAVDVDPCDYGDDAEFDALWDACADGSGRACDDLYFQSPFGSRYEQFGDTCGDREAPGFPDCPGRYPG